MSLPVNEILGGRALTGVIQGIKGGVPGDVLPTGLMTGTPRRVEGDTGSYLKVNGTRKTAKQIMRGAASRARTVTGVSEVPVKLINVAESNSLSLQAYHNLMSTDGATQRLGEQEIARQVAESRMYLDNLRLAVTASSFSLVTDGKISFDSSGNLLGSTSGAAFSVDFGIPSGNKNQLDVFGTGAIIGASWATSTTKIISHIELIKQASRRKTGYALKHAIYGPNILDYFLTNAQMKEYLNRYPVAQSSLAAGVIPNGLFGMSWWPGYEMFFTDNDGTDKMMWAADQITFLPDPTAEWFEILEGSTEVPTSLNVEADASASLRNIEKAYGRFSYSTIKTDPVMIKHVYGDCFLPVIKVPGAVFMADVTP